MLVFVLGLPSCSKPDRDESRVADADAIAFAAPTELSATLSEPADILLAWTHHATEAGGYWVEFTTPGTEFVKLAAVWPHPTTFRHPAVAPDSEYSYRIRPFFGRPSEAVGVMTGPAPADGAPNAEAEGPLEEPSSGASDGAPKAPLKTTLTAGKAAPAGLTAALATPTSVDLRWQDRAADEDGYLVEIAAHPEKPFKICALLPPEATSFKKTNLPPEMKCWFRVRAFFYGESSPVVSVMTRKGTRLAQ